MMSLRQCIVCKNMVPEGYESDHLRANHLGPHRFWFDAREYVTDKPSMTGGELVKMCDGNVMGWLVEDRGGPPKDVYFGHGEAIDLTHLPHFFILLPATMYNGMP